MNIKNVAGEWSYGRVKFIWHELEALEPLLGVLNKI